LLADPIARTKEGKEGARNGSTDQCTALDALDIGNCDHTSLWILPWFSDKTAAWCISEQENRFCFAPPADVF